MDEDVIPRIQGSLRPQSTRCEYGWGFSRAQDGWFPWRQALQGWAEGVLWGQLGWEVR